MRAAADAGRSTITVTTQVMRDISYAMTTTNVDTLDGVTRIETIMHGSRFHVYVAKDGATPKLLGSPECYAGVGRHVLRLLARKEDAGALRLLDWISADATTVPPAARATVAGAWAMKFARDRDSMLIAGALLAGETDPAALPTLARCSGRTGADREPCDATLAAAYEKAGRWKDLEAHAALWATRTVDPQRASLARGRAFLALGKLKEAEAIAAEILARKADHSDAIRLSAAVAVERGDLAEAVRRYGPLRTGWTTGADADLAWLHLVAERDLATGKDLATRGLGGDTARSQAVLAAIHAELGEISDAKTALSAAITARGGDRPSEPIEWFAIGRIAEHVGQRDDAIAAYRRIAPPAATAPPPRALQPYTLARRRLDKLGVK
jgi:tetratricopeptide (TPR) repeat protein